MSHELEFTRGDMIAEKYEVVDLLDESPLGVTYRTKHVKTGKYVRLVVLRPRIAGRDQKNVLLESFRRTKALAHPHLVKVGELGEHNGVAYVTYEDFDGTTLRELFRTYRAEGRSFELAEAAQITQQILEALDALHQAGFVLRALRPDHVLVSGRYTGPRRSTFIAHCKVVAPLWDLVPTAMLAEDEFTRGDAQYVAPELKDPETVADVRADLYSAGAILYEALAGAPPVGVGPQRLARPGVPAHLVSVLDLALAVSPDDRYPTAADFIANLSRTFQESELLESRARSSLLSPAAWGLAFTLVGLSALLVLTTRRDPRATAEEADAAIREEVYREIQAATPSLDTFERIYAQHPPNMVYLPAGPYVAGRLHDDTFSVTSEPLAERRQTDGFLIDMFEYPNLPGAVPRFDVTWDEASRLCGQVGKRLCTADEWERACKGARSLVYSYGDTYDSEYCGAGLADRRPTGTADGCRSEFGVYDMSGNFREWTGTTKKAGRMIVKGGMIGSPEKGTRCAQAEDESVSYTDRTLSFRCCRDVDAPPASETAAANVPAAGASVESAHPTTTVPR